MTAHRKAARIERAKGAKTMRATRILLIMVAAMTMLFVIVAPAAAKEIRRASELEGSIVERLQDGGLFERAQETQVFGDIGGSEAVERDDDGGTVDDGGDEGDDGGAVDDGGDEGDDGGTVDDGGDEGDCPDAGGDDVGPAEEATSTSRSSEETGTSRGRTELPYTGGDALGFMIPGALLLASGAGLMARSTRKK